MEIETLEGMAEEAAGWLPEWDRPVGGSSERWFAELVAWHAVLRSARRRAPLASHKQKKKRPKTIGIWGKMNSFSWDNLLYASLKGQAWLE
jgi:hypothetical protein